MSWKLLAYRLDSPGVPLHILQVENQSTRGRNHFVLYSDSTQTLASRTIREQ